MNNMLVVDWTSLPKYRAKKKRGGGTRENETGVLCRSAKKSGTGLMLTSGNVGLMDSSCLLFNF